MRKSLFVVAVVVSTSVLGCTKMIRVIGRYVYVLQAEQLNTVAFTVHYLLLLLKRCMVFVRRMKLVRVEYKTEFNVCTFACGRRCE